MSLAKILVVPVVVVFGAGAYLWSKGYRGPEGVLAELGIGTDEGKKAKSAAFLVDDPQAKTEGRWIVDEVTRDIAEIVLFASDAKVDPSRELELTVTRKAYGDVYDVSVTGPKGTVSQMVTLKHHIWSPADHAPWAAALLKAWQPEKSSSGSSTPDSDGMALALQLTDPAIGNIIREERRLSKLLNKQPLDPELHEQAALVIGTLALREAAGSFNDVRPALCRMATHLSLARALRPASGVCGQLAEAVQLTLAVRQAEALEIVAKLPAGLEPWVTALKMRNTGDWRLCADPAKATFLEQITWARTTILGVSPAMLQAFLQKSLPQSQAPDWSRAVMNADFGVEHGHVFVQPSILLELADFAAASEAWDGRPLEKEQLFAFLDEPAGRAVERSNSGFELAVLGWGQVAAHYQRQLCWSLYCTDLFLRDKWGVPDQAADLEQQIHAQFSDLRLYPLLVRRLMTVGGGQYIPESVFESAMRDAVDICKEQPQLISPASWVLLGAKLGGLPMPEAVPSAQGWFQPSLPQGTAFDFDHRIHALRLPALPQGGTDYNPFWEQMLTLAPYDYDILRGHVASCPNQLPPAERDRQAFKNVSEFNVHAMRKIAGHQRHDARAYASAMALVCALEPNQYITVAWQLAQAGCKEEAAVAYQAAFDKASDRVSMANNSEWIVNYYFDQGRKEDALKIAKHAAEVYSFGGLETAAKLMERMEKWEEAASYYGAIAERYGAAGPLVQFASRRMAHDPAMGELYEKFMGSVFPAGLKKVSLADFSSEPDKGVRIADESHYTRQWKLRVDDIVVALDGVRVENFEQYDLVRSMQPPTTPLALIVWDGHQYREVSASVPDRRFRCSMPTYKR